MAVAQISNCLAYTPIRNVFASNSIRISLTPMHLKRDFARFPTSFATGSPLLLRKASCPSSVSKGTSIRCEQSTKGGSGLDVWIGRLAMAGFAAALSVEIATGKGLLENFGLTTALPGVALAVTAVVGVLTAFFIFQSGPKS